MKRILLSSADKLMKDVMESSFQITSIYPFWMEGRGDLLLLLWRDHWSVLPAFTILVLVFLLMHLSQEYTLFNGIQYSPSLPCTVYCVWISVCATFTLTLIIFIYARVCTYTSSTCCSPKKILLCFTGSEQLPFKHVLQLQLYVNF